VLIYAGHNAAATVAAFVGGHLIDRSSPRLAFTAGAALYVLAYVGFAVGSSAWPLLLLAFVLAGLGIGLSETSESALVAGAVPDHLRGSAFGARGSTSGRRSRLIAHGRSPLHGHLTRGGLCVRCRVDGALTWVPTLFVTKRSAVSSHNA
jgi:Major Facilitator Superfamily